MLKVVDIHCFLVISSQNKQTELCVVKFVEYIKAALKLDEYDLLVYFKYHKVTDLRETQCSM